MRSALAVVALAALAVPAAGIAKRSVWVWTEAYAEGRVVKKVHIPCTRVRSKKDCDVKGTRARYESWRQKEDRCKQIEDPAKSARCLISMANHLSDAKIAYRYARRGFALESATCLGTGRADKTGKMFPEFRCKVLFEDQRVAPTINLNGDVVDEGKTIKYTARLVVYVTGRTSFRWKIT
jgi:hypothetical protein